MTGSRTLLAARIAVAAVAVAAVLGLAACGAKSGEAPAKGMVWYVAFEAGSSGATSNVIEVDARTGKATVQK